MGLLMVPLGNRVCVLSSGLLAAFAMGWLACHWFLVLGFAKSWLVSLEFIKWAKLGFGAFICYLTPHKLLLVLCTRFYWNVLFSVPDQGYLFHNGILSSLCHFCHIILWKITCSLCSYFSTYPLPYSPWGTWEILEPFHTSSESKVIEEHKLSMCLCLATLISFVYLEASSSCQHIRNASDFPSSYLTKPEIYPHSPTMWMPWHASLVLLPYLNPSPFVPSTGHNGLSYWCFYM